MPAVICPGLDINAGSYKKEAVKFCNKFRNSEYQTEKKQVDSVRSGG